MKKFLSLLLMLILVSPITFASEQINIKEFSHEMKEYGDELFPEFSDEDWITDVIGR